MSVQASRLMAAIAALTGLVWRTVIEHPMPWRRHPPVTLADQHPESPRSVSGPLARPGGPDRPARDEPLGSAGGVGRAGAHPQVHQLAGVGPAGQQRVVAKAAGGAVGRPPLAWPWTSHTVESRSIVGSWAPGPAPAATPGPGGLSDPV
jgi:hypothetical protein